MSTWQISIICKIGYPRHKECCGREFRIVPMHRSFTSIWPTSYRTTARPLMQPEHSINFELKCQNRLKRQSRLAAITLNEAMSTKLLPNNSVVCRLPQVTSISRNEWKNYC